MLNLRLDTHAGLLQVRKTRSVTAMADALLNGDRGRLRRYLNGSIAVGDGTRDRFVSYISEAIEEIYGAPVLCWQGVEEEIYLRDLRQADNDSISSDAEIAKRAKHFFWNAYTQPGLLRTCAHDVSETIGESVQVTVRRALLNVLGMHVARRFAEHFPVSKEISPRDAAHLALHRARCAANLIAHAVESADDDRQRFQLMAISAYIRINRVAVASLFRESLHNIRGVSFFPDALAVEETVASADVDLNSMLEVYKRGHPDRFVLAANALVFASMMKSIHDAVRAWEFMVDENPDAVDLSQKFETHERPLSESPDMEWLIAQNDMSTQLVKNTGIYRLIERK